MNGQTASQRIDLIIDGLSDWRGKTLDRIRTLILDADSEIIEEIKWVKPTNPNGVPVWSRAGIICTGEVYRDKVKLTFAKGASLADPSRLFNSSLDAGTRRALDLFEDSDLDDAAFIELIREASAANGT